VIREFCVWLGNTPWSVGLHESQYMYAIVESVHVWTLCIFLGMAVLFDLRLLGWVLRDVPVSSILRRLLPWSIAGFAVMVVTGMLLAFAIPVRTYHSVFFRAKAIMLLVAGLNAFYFHRRTQPGLAAWDTSLRIPRAARMAGAVSLALWLGIVVAGRMIAYNWFDCDRQPQPALVNWAAGCVLDEGFRSE
jgi:hypothetical protein